MSHAQTHIIKYLRCLAGCSATPEEQAEIQAYASAIEEAGRKWDAQQAPAMAVDFATETAPAESAGAWRTDAPPTDGTPIMAIGQVCYSYEGGGESVPFDGIIYWPQNVTDSAGWRFLSDGLSVMTDVDGKIRIHWWMPLPAEYVGGRGASQDGHSALGVSYEEKVAELERASAELAAKQAEISREVDARIAAAKKAGAR